MRAKKSSKNKALRVERWLKRFSHNERGFTLVEMIFVLAIVGMLSIIVLPISFAAIEQKSYTNAIRQMELIVRMAQMMAMEEKRVVVCEAAEGNRFIVRGPIEEEYAFELRLPEGMTMDLTTQRRRLRFQPSGNVMESGKMIFYVEGSKIYYTINLGKGRFILYE